MKPENIKFISNDQQRQFAYNVRKNVNAYFTENKISPKGNTTLVVKTIIMLSLYIPIPLDTVFPPTVECMGWLVFISYNGNCCSWYWNGNYA